MEIKLRLDPTQFGVIFDLCKKNPLFGYKLGYVSNGHMTPEQFIRTNQIELIDDEPVMVQVVDYDKLVGCHG